jgi:hypothetical protein
MNQTFAPSELLRAGRRNNLFRMLMILLSCGNSYPHEGHFTIAQPLAIGHVGWQAAPSKSIAQSGQTW